MRHRNYDNFKPMFKDSHPDDPPAVAWLIPVAIFSVLLGAAHLSVHFGIVGLAGLIVASSPFLLVASFFMTFGAFGMSTDASENESKSSFILGGFMGLSIMTGYIFALRVICNSEILNN